MKNFLKRNFFKLSTLLLLIFVIYPYIKNNSSQEEKLNNITFGWPGTTFTDMMRGNEDSPLSGYLYIQGSLTGENLEKLLYTSTSIGKTNNKVMISCNKLKMECTTYTLTQYGENQVSDLPAPDIFPITRWDNDFVVAVADNYLQCTKITINIDRKLQETEWVQEPYNQDKTWCKDSYGSTYKWIIKKPGLEN